MIGQIVQHYRVLESLGRGGMGQVYKAEDVRLGRAVALKFLDEGIAAEPEALKRFEREARAASALNHPHICTLYDVGEFDGRPFLVMELLGGRTLKERLAHGPLAWDTAVRYASDVADALAAAHASGIIHRDIKPANLWITDRDEIKVLDFGLAKRFDEPATADAPTLTGGTARGVLLGTIAYMSPEQALGRDVGPPSDLFSLGGVVYEMVAGVPPFRGATVIEQIDQILHGRPEPLEGRGGQLPAAFLHLVERLLAKAPADRYPSAESLLASLKRLQTGDASAVELRPAKPPERSYASIAVLPFLNLGPTPEHEYFGDGLAEELISNLARLEGLRVAPRTSAFSFKRKDVDIRSIAGQLGVKTVLEGSIRVAGDRLRVAVQLVDVAEDRHLWSERFDRRLDDVFAIQDEIAQMIVERLRVRLTDGRDAPLTRHRTENPEVYQLYLKGRFYWAQRYQGGMRAAIEHFQQAIQVDPSYVLPYVGLADVFSFLGLYSLVKPREVFAKARAMVERARALDPDLPELHTSSALIKLGDDWDWAGAEREFRRALELDPAQGLTRIYLGWLDVLMGRAESGIAEAKRAQVHDALSPLIHTGVAYTCFLARRYEEAIAETAKALALDAHFLVGLYVAGMSHGKLRHYAEAIELLEKAATLSNRAPFYLGLLGEFYGEAGRASDTRRILDELHELAKTTYVHPHCFAAPYVGLGDLDQAFAWQERACDDGAAPFNFFTPAIELMHTDPRHREHLRRMGYRG